MARSYGVDVSVVVVTDGSASHPGSSSWPPHRIAHQRKQELLNALNILGVRRPPRFLDLPDARTADLRADQKLKAQTNLSTHLSGFSPDIVLTTWRREPHSDHRITNGLTRDAMSQCGSTARFVEYMVWTYLIGTAEDRPKPNETASIYLDIGAVRERKRSALGMHRSQLGEMIGDDPQGFVLTRPLINAMISGDEQFEIASLLS